MPPSTLSESKPVTARIKRQTGRPSVKPQNNGLRLVMVSLIALLLVAGLYRMLAKPPAASTVTVVAAGKDIPPGYRLGFRDLHFLTIPKAYLTADMVSSYPELVGRFSSTYLAMGEPILKDQLMPGTRPLSDRLGVNERALTLKLTDETLVDNAVMPGDRVDVLSTTAAENGKKFTQTICQDVLVLMAVPRKMLLCDKLHSSDANKITLAVHPDVAEKLAQAADASKLRVVLRNRTNHLSYSLAGADDRDLLPAGAFKTDEEKIEQAKVAAQQAAARQQAVQPQTIDLPPAPPAPLSWMVEIFKGATKESYEFPRQ